MDWTTVAREWGKFGGGIQEKWGEVTDDDLRAVGGSRRAFAATLREHYQLHGEAAEREIDAWLATLPEPPEQGMLDQEAAESEGMGQARYAPRDTLLPSS